MKRKFSQIKKESFYYKTTGKTTRKKGTDPQQFCEGCKVDIRLLPGSSFFTCNNCGSKICHVCILICPACLKNEICIRCACRAANSKEIKIKKIADEKEKENVKNPGVTSFKQVCPCFGCLGIYSRVKNIKKRKTNHKTSARLKELMDEEDTDSVLSLPEEEEEETEEEEEQEEEEEELGEQDPSEEKVDKGNIKKK